MDLLILFGVMLPMPLIIIGTYILIHRRRAHHARHKRRKIKL